MRYVVDAVYVGEYKLRVRFDNDEVRIVDLAGRLDGPVFEPLKDLPYFKQFRVDHDIDTVVWPNNADFAPDFLYEIGAPAGAFSEHADSPAS